MSECRMSNALGYAECMKSISRPVLVWALAGSVFAGSLTALQARLNGQLGAVLANGVLAAFVSFLVTLVLVALIVVSTAHTRRGVRALVRGFRQRDIPRWMLFGGVAGAMFVTIQATTVGMLGVSLFMLGVVAGQVVAGVIFDAAGVGPGGKVAASRRRILGALLAVVAVTVAVWSNLGSVQQLWMIGFALISGSLISWQAGVNGHFNRVSGSGLVATFANFLTGTVALFVATAVSLLLVGMPEQWPSEVWTYLGGPLAIIFISLSSYFVRLIGVLVLGLANIAGQLMGALLLDIVAPVTRFTLSVGLVAGCALALVALLVASWDEWKPATGPRE